MLTRLRSTRTRLAARLGTATLACVLAAGCTTIPDNMSVHPDSLIVVDEFSDEFDGVHSHHLQITDRQTKQTFAFCRRRDQDEGGGPTFFVHALWKNPDLTASQARSARLQLIADGSRIELEEVSSDPPGGSSKSWNLHFRISRAQLESLARAEAIRVRIRAGSLEGPVNEFDAPSREALGTFVDDHVRARTG